MDAGPSAGLERQPDHAASGKRPLLIVLAVTLAAGGVVAAIVLETQRDVPAVGHDNGRGARVAGRAQRPTYESAASAHHGRDALSVEREIRRLMRLGLPVYCGGDRRRYVALTFDDGPGPYTTLALRILRHDHARATFFLVGRNLSSAGRLPRAERAVGAIGDHTWTHAFLPGLSLAAMEAQLARTQSALAHSTGAPVQLFRPPYGAHTTAIDAESRRLGMLEVLWSVDSRDWAGAPWDRIARIVERAARPGSIVLMHENHGQTIRALKFAILPTLRRRGLVPVSVTQLLTLDPPTPTQIRTGLKGCLRRRP